MPSMYKIYQKNSFEYDELVNNEDYNGNLNRYLLDNFNFNNKSVIELGAGTGRVSKVYAEFAKKVFLYDRSKHMLEKANENLRDILTPIEYGVLDNNEIHKIKTKADIVIEGWSFGHTVIDNQENLFESVKKLVNDCIKIASDNGIIIFIETLGTNSKTPKAPDINLAKFYSLLENEYNFNRTVLETDYKFKSNQEAKRISGFFFGNNFLNNLSFEEEGIIKEYTGVWSFCK